MIQVGMEKGQNIVQESLEMARSIEKRRTRTNTLVNISKIYLDLDRKVQRMKDKESKVHWDLSGVHWAAGCLRTYPPDISSRQIPELRPTGWFCCRSMTCA